MKFSRIFKKFAAAAVTGALLVSMMGVTAFAAGGVVSGTETEPITSVAITKKVLTDGNTYAPATSFSYQVEVGDPESSFYDGTQTVVVYKGVARGLTATDAAQSVPSTDGLGTGGVITLFDTGTLTIDAAKFSETGVYHYVVSEVNGGYEGIVYDTATYDVYLYVYQKADGSYYVGNVVSVTDTDGDGDKEKADLVFSNNYGSGTNDSTHDITVTKSVAGSMGDKSKEFEFKVSVTSSNSELYKVVVKTTDSDAGTVYTITANDEPVSYKIKDGGSIQIYGLSATDNVTIVETDYSTDGYTTTYSNSDSTPVQTGTTVSADNTAVTVTNTRDAVTPTGIVRTIAPYALMVAIAGVLAALFLRRRKYNR